MVKVASHKIRNHMHGRHSKGPFQNSHTIKTDIINVCDITLLISASAYYGPTKMKVKRKMHGR